jgi:hypothetical protein
MQFLGGVSVAHRNDYLTDSSLATFLTQPAYTIIDARIGITQQGRWELLLIGNNLSNELILNNGMVFLTNAGT